MPALIERPQRSERFNPACSHAIFELLKLSECSSALCSGMDSESRIIRRHCFRLAAENPAFRLEQIVEKATGDSDVLIRRWAFGVTPHVADWQARAAADPYAPIRRTAFESMEDLDELLPFLFDRSPGIRSACQTVVSQRFSVPPAEVYRRTIREQTGPRMAVCLLGLAETGDASDLPLVLEAMGNGSARVRTSAVRALRALGCDAHIDLLIRTLSVDVPSVATEAGLTLLERRDIPASSIWKAAASNPEPRVRLRMLRRLKHKGKWCRLAIYLESVSDPDSHVSEGALELIDHWVRSFNANCVEATAAERASIPALLQRVSAKLPAAVRREVEFAVRTALR